MTTESLIKQFISILDLKRVEFMDLPDDIQKTLMISSRWDSPVRTFYRLGTLYPEEPHHIALLEYTWVESATTWSCYLPVRVDIGDQYGYTMTNSIYRADDYKSVGGWHVNNAVSKRLQDAKSYADDEALLNDFADPDLNSVLEL
jgi:hypothetical protein